VSEGTQCSDVQPFFSFERFYQTPGSLWQCSSSHQVPLPPTCFREASSTPRGKYWTFLRRGCRPETTVSIQGRGKDVEGADRLFMSHASGQHAAPSDHKKE
jgi:hypothetical protein